MVISEKRSYFDPHTGRAFQSIVPSFFNLLAHLTAEQPTPVSVRAANQTDALMQIAVRAAADQEQEVMRAHRGQVLVLRTMGKEMEMVRRALESFAKGNHPKVRVRARPHTHTHTHTHAHTHTPTLTHTHERTHARARKHALPVLQRRARLRVAHVLLPFPRARPSQDSPHGFLTATSSAPPASLALSGFPRVRPIASSPLNGCQPSSLCPPPSPRVGCSQPAMSTAGTPAVTRARRRAR